MKGKIPQFYHTFAAFDPRHKNAYLNDHCYIETWENRSSCYASGHFYIPCSSGNWKGIPFWPLLLSIALLLGLPRSCSQGRACEQVRLVPGALCISGSQARSIRWWRKLLLTHSVARRRPDANLDIGTPPNGLGVITRLWWCKRPILQFDGPFGLLELAPNTLTQSASVKINSWSIKAQGTFNKNHGPKCWGYLRKHKIP